MKVLLDAHMLGEHEGGNESYINGLLQGFQELTIPEDVHITALYNSSYLHQMLVIPNLHNRVYKTKNNFARLLLEIPRLSWNLKADILHLTYNAPLYFQGGIVLTVHDVIFRTFPEWFSPRVRLLLSIILPISMRRARRILTISEASRSDIEKYYPFTEGKIIVIPLAAGPVVTVESHMLDISDITGDGEFILAAGTIQPRKNIKRLIQAYLRMRKAAITSARLIIVGRSGWMGSDIQKLAKNTPFAQDIIFTGYLDDITLNALYHNCRVFVYPSICEGFGLPVLEAMSCGAPVITSNKSSLIEIAGDAAQLVDPYDVEHIARAISDVLTQPYLREALIHKGLQKAKSYTWKKTAQQTLEAYQEAYFLHKEIS